MVGMRRIGYAVGMAVIAAAPLAASPAQAGLLDFLFGGGQPTYNRPAYPTPAYGYETQPLKMRVSPRRAKAKNQGGPSDRKLARSIDPVKVPTWYLQDPTLRRGDIVVVKSGAFVFGGGARGAASSDDFTALQNSKLVSSGERQRLQAMVGKPASATISDPITVGQPQPAAQAEGAAKEAALVPR